MLSNSQFCFLTYLKRKPFYKCCDTNVTAAVLLYRNVQTQSAGDESNDVLTDSSMEDTALEEQIERKRNKSRLPEFVYKVHVKKEVPDPLFKYQFRKNNLQRHYGIYGESSKLNPGILWPTKDELKDIKEFESKYMPPLKEMLEKVKAEKEQKEQEKRDYEKEVEKNLANYPKVLSDYYAKISKAEEEAEQLKKKRAILIEEISEYLGYDVDPRDPRFQEAVALREKEKKKALKVKKEKESYAKMLQKLTEIAENPDK